MKTIIKMKKILFVTKSFHPFSFGGVETVIDNLSNGLKVNFKIDIFSTNKKYNKIIKKKKLNHYTFLSNFSLINCPFSIKFLFFYIKNIKNYDVVNFHYPWPFMDILILFTPKNVKKIVTYHADAISKYRIINFLYFFIAHFFLSKVDLIVATSKNYFSSSKILKVFKKKVKIIPLGITKSSFSNGTYRHQDYILFLGNERKYKGIDIIIKSSSSIKSRIIIAGKISDYLTNKIKNFENITIIKNPSEKIKFDLIKKCSLLILPSTERSEAFGIVLLEAAICKKPVLSTLLNTGTSYIIKNNYNGVLIPPNSSKKLSNKINKLLMNKKNLTRMGRNNYIRYKKYFTANLMLNEYYKLFNSDK